MAYKEIKQVDRQLLMEKTQWTETEKGGLEEGTVE